MILTAITTCYLACGAAQASVANDYDPFEGAVPVLRFSFEKDEDREFDGQPDDWTRRKGPEFPAYVETEIDRTRGRHEAQSLLFHVNGGQAITYSPPVHIDAQHSYVFQGFIRTQLLKNDAALLSVSLLDHRRRRIQRFLSRPVSGTHADWVRVRIGPIAPKSDVRFVVIGCHLVQSPKKVDIHGKVWFDDLWLGKLPQLSMESSFAAHFKRRNHPIEVASRVSGLDPGHTYRLRLEMVDSSGHVSNSTTIPLAADEAAPETPTEEDGPVREPVVWKLPPQEYGFYRVKSILERDGTRILEKQTSFAVMDLVAQRNRGIFGWSIRQGPTNHRSVVELADVAVQSGINWLKYPLWNSLDSDDPQLAAQISLLLERLSRRHVTPIGLLSEPPETLRKQFARNWSGLSEVFTLPPSFWKESLEPVIARYSSTVRHWQLGGEDDNSFVGMQQLETTLETVKSEFDRIGRDTQLWLHWNWTSPVPHRTALPHTALSLSNDRPLSGDALTRKLQESAKTGVPRFVVLRPLPRSQNSPEERGTDLVKRMIAAKIGGADGIFASDVFDPEYGLLRPDGSPTLLFLPWRTTCLALQGSTFLGSIQLPKGSKNFAFSREGKVTLIVWADEPRTETIYLGERIRVTDLWGRQIPVRTESGTSRQVIRVSATPRIIHGCSEPITRWRMATDFRAGRLRSEHGDHAEALLGLNTFSQGIDGTVTVNIPPNWGIDRRRYPLQIAAGERFNLPMTLTLPPNASLGTKKLSLDFSITADRPYKFRVHRLYQVGYGDVLVDVIDRKLEDGRLEIEQLITNNITSGEVLNFRCSLFVPGRRRQRKFVTKLGRGVDRKFYYLPDAESLKGQTLWLRAQQTDGRRVLNFRFEVGKRWDEAENETSLPAPGIENLVPPPQR